MDTAESIALLLNELLQKRGIPSQLNNLDDASIRKAADEFIAIRDFTHVISNGDLSQTLEVKGYWAGALKALQSNLRHLTWQAGMVASGDYSQRVFFMGDFSTAFNTMIKRLEQAEENEKKYIAAIRESEQKYRLIAENTGDVILLMDRQLQVEYVSPSIERLLGYTPEEFSKLPVNERVLPPLEAALCKLPENEPDNAAPVLIELEQRCKNGKLIWMESLVSVARNEAGEFSGFLCVTRNITVRKLTENLLQRSYVRRRRNEFLNELLQDNGTEAQVYTRALQLGLQLPKQFAVYLLCVDGSDRLTVNNSPEVLQHRQKTIDTILDMLNTQDSTTIAWEAAEGIGILQDISDLAERKATELKIGQNYIQRISGVFPELKVCIGIADYFEGVAFFTRRFQHARTAATVGQKLLHEQSVCHFEDCGVYQVLMQFTDTAEAELFVERALGPLLEYDKVNGTDLIFTLEKILTGSSIKEVAKEIFVHYKTIAFRKQRIEQILGITLDCAKTRMLLDTALHLLKIIRTSKRTV